MSGLGLPTYIENNAHTWCGCNSERSSGICMSEFPRVLLGKWVVTDFCLYHNKICSRWLLPLSLSCMFSVIVLSRYSKGLLGFLWTCLILEWIFAQNLMSLCNHDENLTLKRLFWNFRFYNENSNLGGKCKINPLF